jgi:hypothetical protein
MRSFIQRVTAEQYTSDSIDIPGVHILQPEVFYSADEKYFYVTDYRYGLSKDWISVEKGANGKHEALPFAQWKIRSGRHETISADHDLYRLYALSQEWKGNPPPHAYILNEDGTHTTIADGDWIIAHRTGRYSALKPETFYAEYERVS